MSDAGKVLVGTDGNPLLSADGKIMIADNLYPIVPTQQRVSWWRDLLSYSSCAAYDVWATDWTSNPNNSLYASYQNNTGTFTVSIQMLYQFKFAGSGIDWTRVKKLTLPINLLLTGDAQNGRITKSINNTSLPSGKTVRDSWDTVFTTADTGEHIVEWEINGVEPTSLEIAIMFDGESCTLSGASLFELNTGSGTPDIRIVYNLAT